MQTVKILEEIAAYLNGLDNIVMGTSKSKIDAFCETPVYGTLIIVINKMMGMATDEELMEALMTPEPGLRFCLDQIHLPLNKTLTDDTSVKQSIIKTFFVFHPILIKLGGVVENIGTTTSPSVIKIR